MNIKYLRKTAKLTQGQLAEQVNVKQSSVSSWESGRCTPKATLLPQLAVALGCTIDDLFDAKGGETDDRD